MQGTELVEPASGVSTFRRVGRARLALAFFVMQLAAIFTADALLGPRGLGWFRGAGAAGGIGAAFGLTWAYLVWLRLARGQTWPRALVAAFAVALFFVASAVFLMHFISG